MIKTIFKIITILSLILFGLVSCKSNDSITKLRVLEEINEKLENSNYTFVADRANPLGGRSIHLTSEYSLKVSSDTIEAFLPYYGRAYSASSSTDGGIKFVSTIFDYQISEKKKGVSRVSIKINDNQNRYKLSLLIGETGNCTLYVDQMSKQGITFTGVIH